MDTGKRITKKQMKEDKLVSSVFKASEYIQKNPKPFIIGGSAAVIIFIGVTLFVGNIGRKNSEAAGYLTRAQISYDRGLINDAIVDLKSVVDDYPNTPFAGPACFLLGNIFFENKNYEEALPYFVRMVENYPEDKMKASGSAAGAAACHEQLGNRQEAGRFYKLAADLFPDEMWAPAYLLSAGRNFAAAGDLESAKLAFNKIITDYKQSRELNTAKRSLAEIES